MDEEVFGIVREGATETAKRPDFFAPGHAEGECPEEIADEVCDEFHE